MHRVIRIAICGIGLLGGLGPHTAAAQTAAAPSSAAAPAATPTPAAATVDQLAWIAGAWTGTLGDRTIEQHWTAPLGGSMIAMYRSVRAGKPTLYELLAIEPEGSGVALRIKHFTPGPGLVGQEAKEEAVNHALIKLEGKTAVFEGGPAASPIRVTFASPDSSTLNITVERTRDGKPVSTEFKYRRIGG